MLSVIGKSATFLVSPRTATEDEEDPRQPKFDNKWLRSRRQIGTLKPLALFRNDILTHSGTWRIPTAGSSKVASTINPLKIELNDVKGSKLGTIAQNGNTCDFLFTWTKCTVTAINYGSGNLGEATVLAEDLENISTLEFTSNGKWIAIGVDSQAWLLNLDWGQDFKIAQITHHATFEGHKEPVSGLHFTETGFETRLVTISHDRTFNIWAISKPGCLYESPLLGQFSLTASALIKGQKSTQILVMGNCDGKVFLFEIVHRFNEAFATKVDEIKITSSHFQKNLISQHEEKSTPLPNDDFKTIRPKRKSRASIPETISLETLAIVSERTYQGCEIVTFLDLGCETGPFDPHYVLVGTTTGVLLVNVKNREIGAAVSYDHLLTHSKSEENVLGAMMSTVLLSQSHNNQSIINVVTQSMTDEKTAFFQVKFQSPKETIIDENMAIVAQAAPRGFLKHIQRNVEEMTGVKPAAEVKQSLGKRLMKMASASRRVKSSGYGKTDEQPFKMFRPRINTGRHSSKNSKSRAWESNDEGFISPSSSLEDLSSSDNNELPTSSTSRPKWKRPKQIDSKKAEKSPLAALIEGPQKMTACVKLWQTDGVHTRLFFAPNGQALAASGAHNSVQVISSQTLLKLENKDDFTRCDTLEKGSRLMGHIAPVNFVDFAGGNSDFLVTSGRDRGVKIWHWKSKTVKLTIDLRKQGRGTGLGKGSVFGSVYGGISAQSNSSQLLQKMHKKSEKFDDSVKPFPDSVTQSQFYYLDQFLLSASSNQLFVHQIGMPSQQKNDTQKRLSSQDFWFKYACSFTMDNCKNISAICAPNQFYSHLTLVGCSDKTMRILNVNSQQTLLQIGQPHTRPISKIILGKSTNGENAMNSASHNLFLTAAIADGAKLWDIRAPKTCVQKLSWPGSSFGRIQLGIDVCPNFRYFAGGSDDGSVYLFDIRKPCSGYVTRLMGGSSKPIPNHANHSNGYNRSPITDVVFHAQRSNTLVASTLDGELLKFE